MSGGVLPWVVMAVLLPLAIGELREWWPRLAVRLVRWSARRLGDPQACARYEEEWVANLEEVPGKLSPLVAALGYLVAVPRMRRVIRRGPVPLNVRPAEIPDSPEEFVGRLDELARLDAHLFQHTLRRPSKRGVPTLLVTGAAGVGKTALVLRWAHLNQAYRFPDGNLYAWFSGRDIGEPVDAFTVLGRFLRALGVRPAHIPATLEERTAVYRTLTARRRLLVVLENAYFTDQVRPLLPAGPRSFTIVISRWELADFAELGNTHHFQVAPFDHHDAIEFLQRTVGEAQVNRELDAAQELARFCAYLPLALSVASKHLAIRREKPFHRLNAELVDASNFPEELSDDPTAGAEWVFDNSYSALPAAAARLFRRLGALPGGRVAVGDAVLLMACTEAEARRLLVELVEENLLSPVRCDTFHLHPVLHAYARKALHDEEPGYRLPHQD
ncbi:ATP-binding protein [Actinosynnema pretiosum subsp. pretiosum]|uniref:ATP-binding protein n=1 Tax=Actinosynnema pretiosum subsp. pretiosum TaxID=103721 RepID=A0AA45L506_9PSEU|nr:transcriptional regulator, SARP family [Actinosynnema pretiosum subsp. pretiosum]QUF03417.1 ATP-binding protein [Actinosynnema pretiosum subsp. pretiosum]